MQKVPKPVTPVRTSLCRHCQQFHRQFIIKITKNYYKDNQEQKLDSTCEAENKSPDDRNSNEDKNANKNPPKNTNENKRELRDVN